MKLALLFVLSFPIKITSYLEWNPITRLQAYKENISKVVKRRNMIVTKKQVKKYSKLLRMNSN